MTIIIFLVDTSASMLQRTYLGTTYLDYARLAIEQFLKQRQRDPASSGDRYMLMTFEDYPQNIKSGWKESQRIFNEQLKNLKAKGSLKFESCLDSVLRLLLVSRMQSGSGASIEAFGFGRYPSYAEHVVIIPVIDGSSLPLPDSEATVPKPRLLTGSDLFVEGYRWDQRLFPIVLRLPGHLHPFIKQQGLVPPEDNSIAQNFAEQMGGRSFSITSHRALTPCIDHIIQKIQTNGIIIRLQKQGPDPILPNGINETDQSKRDESNDLWKNSLVLIKSKVGQQHSHWPIPEAYWPDSIKTSLPPRNAHPIVVFRCERVEPLFNTDFPLDKYELDSASPLAQFILDVKESNLCWQVFVENSYRQPGLGFPFGYIKISTSATVTLYVMPYNYPELLSLLAMGKDPKIGSSHPQFQHKFEKYLKTVPAYYYSRLKNALSRIKVMPPCLEEANTKLYGYCNLVALQTRIKHQGQQEFESACNAVHKNLQETSLLPPNSASFVKVSRSRSQLSKGALTSCTFRPAVAPFKSLIPADAFKDTNILLLETPSQTLIPSLQFKNPFDIARENLYSQLDKMRLNFDQQVQTSNLHVLEGLGPKRELEPQVARPHAFGNPFKLDKKNMSIVDEVGEMNVNSDEPSSSSSISSAERREQRKRERENRASSEGPGSSGQVIARPKRRPGPLDLSRLAAWKNRRRLMRNQNNSNSLATDILEIQSAPPDAQDFEERSKLEEEDLEDQINEEEEEMEEKGFGDDIQYIELDKSQQQQQKANFWGNNKGNSLETTLQEADDFQQPSSSSMPLLDEEEKPKISQNNQRKPFKRPRLDNGETEIPSFTPVIPTISYKEFLQKQRQIRQLCRQIGPKGIVLHKQLMEIVSDRTLSRDCKRQLLELGLREAQIKKNIFEKSRQFPTWFDKFQKMIFPKIYFSFLFLFCLIYLIKSQESIPQKFFGAFQYENSDNWEAYLAAKGYNEEMRRTVKPPKLTRVLFPTGPGYRMMIGQGLQGSKWLPGAKKNADWTFQLGKEFRAKYWDGREHLILFTYNPSNDRLIERQEIFSLFL
uniref:VWFA domain-containing protein n=1 Tax=Meloidogyne floridensis TaxID=298350 RepID=A0A915NWG5_9BILA